MNATKETYNRIAEDWIEDHDKDTWWLGLITRFTKLLPEGASIHDVGCGGGNQSTVLASRGFAVEGSDASEKMIEGAIKRGAKAKFVVRDMHVSGDGMYDGILFCASLLHIPHTEVKDVLATHVKTLKPGGVLTISVKEQRANQPDEEMKTEDDYGYEYTRFFSYFTEEWLQEVLVELGLEVTDVVKTHVGHTVWLELYAKKPVWISRTQSSGPSSSSSSV